MKFFRLALIGAVLLCLVLSGCADAGFEFSEEPSVLIPKVQTLYPAFSQSKDNGHIAVFGGSYVDLNDGLKVFPLSEIAAANPVPLLEMDVSTHKNAVSCGNYMVLDCENEPLRYIDLTGQTPPVTLNGRRKSTPSSNIVSLVMNGEGVYVLYTSVEKSDDPTTFVVEYVDFSTNVATDILTATGTATAGTTVTRIDENDGRLMVYGTTDGEEYLNEYDSEGVLIGQRPVFPVCMVSEERMLGEALSTEWLDGRLYVMRERGVQVYTLDEQGAYSPVTFAMLTAEYVGFSDRFIWFWRHVSRTVYTLDRQTGEIRTFRLEITGQQLFEATRKELLFDDAGYIFARFGSKVERTDNRLFLFDISKELYK